MQTSTSSIQNLTDSVLLEKVKTLAGSERELTVAILHHLKEVYRRKLFSDLGYESLFKYCVGALGYSPGAAMRRVDGMKLLKEIPEVEKKILDGKLHLSTIVQVETFVRKENKVADVPITREEKKELLKQLEGKSRREAERELLKRSVQPEIHVQEKSRAVSQTHTELNVVLTEEALQNLETIKGYLAHSNPNMSMSELITYLAKFGAEKLNPAREVRVKKVERTDESSEKPQTPATQSVSDLKSKENFIPPAELENSKIHSVFSREVGRSRYIHASLKRKIFQRDRNQCVQCGSKFALEIDHIYSFAKKGPSSEENLQLLCRNCNQRKAIEEYGIDKIEQMKLIG